MGFAMIRLVRRALKKWRLLKKERQYRQRIEAIRWGFRFCDVWPMSEAEILEAAKRAAKIWPQMAKASMVTPQQLQERLRAMDR